MLPCGGGRPAPAGRPAARDAQQLLHVHHHVEGADLPADALDDGALAFALLHAADRDGDGRLGLDDLQVYCAALLAADAEGKGGGGRRGSKARSKVKDGGAEESTTPETASATKSPHGKRRQSAKKLFSGVDLGAK